MSEDRVREVVEFCMSVHYKLMAIPRFWYDKELRGIDMVLCVTASDERERNRWKN
jgi:hypothetical protein